MILIEYLIYLLSNFNFPSGCTEWYSLLTKLFRLVSIFNYQIFIQIVVFVIRFKFSNIRFKIKHLNLISNIFVLICIILFSTCVILFPILIFIFSIFFFQHSTFKLLIIDFRPSTYDFQHKISVCKIQHFNFYMHFSAFKNQYSITWLYMSYLRYQLPPIISTFTIPIK